MSAPLFAQGMRDSAEQGAIDRQLIGDRVHRKPRRDAEEVPTDADGRVLRRVRAAPRGRARRGRADLGGSLAGRLRHGPRKFPPDGRAGPRRDKGRGF